MTYFVGNRLVSAIKQYGLEELVKALYEYKAGTFTWSDWEVAVTVPEPASLEVVRNILYSILHGMGIKQHFTVKQRRRDFILELKGERGRAWMCAFQPVQSIQNPSQNQED